MLQLADELKLNENDNVRSISDKLSTMSFFEDHELQVATPSHVELPLWCGQFKFATIRRKINVLLVTPACFWHCSLLTACGSCLWRPWFWRPCSVCERPASLSVLNNARLSPITRIIGVTDADKEKLLQVAKHLNDNDKHLEVGVLAMMSRTQALSLLSRQPTSEVTKSSQCSLNCNSNAHELFAFFQFGCTRHHRLGHLHSDDSHGYRSLNEIKSDLINVRKTYDTIKK